MNTPIKRIWAILTIGLCLATWAVTKQHYQRQAIGWVRTMNTELVRWSNIATTYRADLCNLGKSPSDYDAAKGIKLGQLHSEWQADSVEGAQR